MLALSLLITSIGNGSTKRIQYQGRFLSLGTTTPIGYSIDENAATISNLIDKSEEDIAIPIDGRKLKINGKQLIARLRMSAYKIPINKCLEKLRKELLD